MSNGDNVLYKKFGWMSLSEDFAELILIQSRARVYVLDPICFERMDCKKWRKYNVYSL